MSYATGYTTYSKRKTKDKPIPTHVDGYLVETSTAKSGYVGVCITLCGTYWKATLGSKLIGQYRHKADAVIARTRAKAKQSANK